MRAPPAWRSCTRARPDKERRARASGRRRDRARTSAAFPAGTWTLSPAPNAAPAPRRPYGSWSAPFARDQHGQSEQHTEEQRRMHAGNLQVVGPAAKVRDAVAGIAHGRWNIDDLQPGPVEAHRRVDIEAH